MKIPPETDNYSIALDIGDPTFAEHLEVPVKSDGRRLELSVSGLLEALEGQQPLAEDARLIIYRSPPTDESEPISFASGLCQIDESSRLFRVANQNLALKWLGFKIMLQLAKSKDRVVPYTEIMQDVWGYDCQGNLNAQVGLIRQKLRSVHPLIADPRGGIIDVTRGVGLRVKSDWSPNLSTAHPEPLT